MQRGQVDDSNQSPLSAVIIIILLYSKKPTLLATQRTMVKFAFAYIRPLAIFAMHLIRTPLPCKHQAR